MIINDLCIEFIWNGIFSVAPVVILIGLFQFNPLIGLVFGTFAGAVIRKRYLKAIN